MPTYCFITASHSLLVIELTSDCTHELILVFDCVLTHAFNGLVAERIKILEGLRVAICLRLVKTVKLGDAHMLGRGTDECNHLSHGSAQIPTAGRLLRGPNRLHKFLPRRV